jgi:fibronectin type 3 domain-containing protein
MKNTIKLFGTQIRRICAIALAAVIGFSMAALSLTGCDNGTTSGGDGLPAPTLTAQAYSSTVINLDWTAIPGAAGYNLYGSRSASSGFELLATRPTNSAGHQGLQPDTTYYYKVAAYTANGTEGAMSNVASATTTGGGTQPTYSLNGIWERSAGIQVTVSGSTGVLSTFANLNTVSQSAVDKGFVKVGDQFWRNLTSTGNLTWSGQLLIINYNTSSPNVAIGTTWSNRTFTMSADGQTLTVTDGTNSTTWTRKQ